MELRKVIHLKVKENRTKRRFPNRRFTSAHMENLDGIAVSILQETKTQDLLNILRPNVQSDKTREEIIHNIRRLIKETIGTKVFPLGSLPVFPFGSFPLKTYLPDEPIDLTVLSHPAFEKNLMNEILSILKEKEQHTWLILELEQHTDFPVQEVQFLGEQDEIVRCLVNKVPVNIYINQVAGLSTLCFLEQVDKYIGRDHIFKRSVILIKSWCYYESRTFGGYYGLLSLYALEIMVLYIINVFHSSIDGPLAVLHKFLDYYGKFDWENYCISINGPVAISSLPRIVATPENKGIELLLTQEFLRTCRETFTAPDWILKNNGEEFTVKHLNVIDPLQDTNNLGCSVRQGNFYRIRSAFALGTRLIQKILMRPEEDFGKELQNFFLYTFNRIGGGQRPDVQAAVSASDTGGSEVSDLTGDYDRYYSYFLHSKWYCHNLAEIERVPSFHLDASQGSIEMVNSQGTNPYYSDMSHLILGELNLGTQARKPEAGTSNLMLETPNQLEVSSEKGTSDFFIDLSEKEFPPLPSKKIIKPTKSDQSTFLPTQLSHQHPSALGTFQFGSTPSSLPALPTHKKLVTSDDLPVLASIDGPSRERPKEDEQINNSAKWFQPYNLDSEKDFPRLQ